MTDRKYDSGGEHSNNSDSSDATFVERIAAPLRAPEFLDASFERRLLSAVHADVLQRHLFGAREAADTRGWWRRPRTLSLSPLAALATAAGLIGILALGSLAIGSALTRPDATSVLASDSRRDTVHVVRFVFVDSTAQSVALVGDFNGWRKTATQLRLAGSQGRWIVSVALAAGRHEYAFIVDGHRWTSDPFAAEIHDDFGTQSSILTLGSI